jgi:hypothetical protein
MPNEPQQPPAVETQVNRREMIQGALRDSSISRLYANGFTIGMSNADAHIVLQLFGRPVAVWNLSYTLAKTLAQKLTGLVNEWEKRTGRSVATTDEVDLAFKEAGEQQ